MLPLLLLALPLPAPAGTSYPIAGVWMYGRPSAASWDAALSNFTGVGGDTVWMFANALRRSSAAAIRASALTKECLVSGVPCADAAAATLRGHGVSVRHYLSYSQATQFSPAALTPCAGVAGSGEYHLPPGVPGGSKNEYWVLALPAAEAGTKSMGCVPERGSEVDVVVVVAARMMYTPTGADSLRLLLDATDRHAMQALAPMPGLPADASAVWQLDDAALPAFAGLVERTTLDLCLRGLAARPSLEGLCE
jgi:hypothetical protein|eukprot:COSAG01_NODE_1148_length_11519_cov_3.641944_16_plen_251_part_00